MKYKYDTAVYDEDNNIVSRLSSPTNDLDNFIEEMKGDEEAYSIGVWLSESYEELYCEIELRGRV